MKSKSVKKEPVKGKKVAKGKPASKMKKDKC